MTDFEKKIISELKQALEFKELNSDYSQWLRKRQVQPTYPNRINSAKITLSQNWR